jgi:hypothetical protein
VSPLILDRFRFDLCDAAALHLVCSLCGEEEVFTGSVGAAGLLTQQRPLTLGTLTSWAEAHACPAGTTETAPSGLDKAIAEIEAAWRTIQAVQRVMRLRL